MFERRRPGIAVSDAGAILSAACCGAPPPRVASLRGDFAPRSAPQALRADALGADEILLDQPLRAVEYQLGRLTNEELVLVERKEDDVRYRPVYLALLTRKGVAAQFRDESLVALAKMDKASRSRVLLEALAKVP